MALLAPGAAMVIAQRIKMHALLLAIAIGASRIASAAPVSVIVGPGEVGTGNCLPFGCQADVRYQQVYGSSLFSSRINIKDITFFNRLFAAGFIDPANYAIYLSVTGLAVGGLDLTDLDNNVGQERELFFAGTLSGSLASSRSFTITGKPYIYDPSRGNLLLEIFKTGGSGEYGTVFLDRFTDDPSIGSSRAFEYGGVIGDSQENYVGLVTRFDGVPLSEPNAAALLAIAAACLAVSRVKRRRLHH